MEYGKIKVISGKREIDSAYGWERDGVLFVGDASHHEIRIGNDIAKMLNYCNTDGGRTLGNGEYYYNTKEEAIDDMIESGETEEGARELAESVLIVPDSYRLEFEPEEEEEEE